ncbi:hypothetical protein LJC20_02835 [Eubacteriales bacterium OttesenSCG-928-M02]|nr:hypothetical protein [Eubacteriales bacterium OttesenSCG-928-M02]
MKRRIAGIIILLCVCCVGLWGCGPTGPAESRWEKSTYTEETFTVDSTIAMAMVYQGYGLEDRVISYTLTNEGTEPIAFDDTIGLEYFLEDTWRVVPLRSEAGTGEERVLEGMQACRVDVDLSLFAVTAFPQGRYRLVRQAGDSMLMAEFSLGEARITAQEMDFGYAPLASLPAEYDATDAQNDGCYTIAEGGVYHQEKVQYFLDKASLGVPAMLRTVMVVEEGMVVRDILFDPDGDDIGRFIVATETFHPETGPSQAPSQKIYGHMSIARVENKRKVCLSNYVSYAGDAPEGAEREIVSPGVADNIDVVATMELRVEEAIQRLGHQLLVFGPDGLSHASLRLEESAFTVKLGEESQQVSLPADVAMALTGIGWKSDSQLTLSGTTADGTSITRTYDIATGTFGAE